MANVQFNRVFGTIVIPFLKFVLMLIFVTAFFACARLFDSINALSLAFAAVLSITTMGLLVPISIVMSKLYDLSLNFRSTMYSENLQITEKKTRKVLETSLESCPLIRCQVGNWYYMEAEAKLTMLHNVLNGLAYLLINESG